MPVAPPLGVPPKVDECRSFDALNRARNVLFGQTDGGPPPWLETAWETMGMDDSELAQAKVKRAGRPFLFHSSPGRQAGRYSS